ncbi:MAG: SPASM domain-containing protein [Treponema sp.]|nr:SPASM domain-containing protein [Treponema sp.]
MHPDGDCNVCCADFKRELKIDNVAKEDLVSIWDSKKLRDFWKLNAEGKRNCFNVCKKCEYPNFSQNENIDDYSNQILQNLKHL